MNKFRFVTIAAALAGSLTANAATVVVGDLPVSGAVRQCTNDSCAMRLPLTAYLPQGAQVTAIRYFTTAGGPQGDTALRQVDPGVDLGWSVMHPAIITSTPTNVLVSTTFLNRSHDRTRFARIEVDFK